jgi:hypothetical protein
MYCTSKALSSIIGGSAHCELKGTKFGIVVGFDATAPIELLGLVALPGLSAADAAAAGVAAVRESPLLEICPCAWCPQKLIATKKLRPQEAMASKADQKT